MGFTCPNKFTYLNTFIIKLVHIQDNGGSTVLINSCNQIQYLRKDPKLKLVQWDFDYSLFDYYNNLSLLSSVIFSRICDLRNNPTSLPNQVLRLNFVGKICILIVQ